MYSTRRWKITLGACLLATTPVQAADWSADWQLRLRHEQVDDAAFAADADASTARLRAAIRGSFGTHWSLLLEGEGIAAAGDYNSGANGRAAWPTIADPPGVELNQAWIGWRSPRGAVVAGRQRIAWDNQRWIGNVGWRQNEQTFDALTLEAKPTAALTLQYGWLDRVHRISGDAALDPLARERALDSHFFRGAWVREVDSVVAYAYLHDDRDMATASTATTGLRWTRAGPRWGWTLEAARQRDHADNPRRFSHAYWLVEPSLQLRGLTWKVGMESLGGDGVTAVQTPLATLHAFNGWADRFTSTPASGLRDGYLSVGGKARKIAWTVAWHDYRADSGSQGLGREWNLSLGRAIGPRWTGLLKFADYRAEGFGRDVRKLWLQFERSGTQSF
jgi:hypothetical protein